MRSEYTAPTPDRRRPPRGAAEGGELRVVKGKMRLIVNGRSHF